VNLGYRSSNFPKIWELPQINRCHKSDTKQCPLWGPINIRRQRTQFGRPVGPTIEICPPLVQVIPTFMTHSSGVWHSVTRKSVQVILNFMTHSSGVWHNVTRKPVQVFLNFMTHSSGVWHNVTRKPVQVILNFMTHSSGVWLSVTRTPVQTLRRNVVECLRHESSSCPTRMPNLNFARARMAFVPVLRANNIPPQTLYVYYWFFGRPFPHLVIQTLKLVRCSLCVSSFKAIQTAFISMHYWTIQ